MKQMFKRSGGNPTVMNTASARVAATVFAPKTQSNPRSISPLYTSNNWQLRKAKLSYRPRADFRNLKDLVPKACRMPGLGVNLTEAFFDQPAPCVAT